MNRTKAVTLIFGAVAFTAAGFIFYYEGLPRIKYWVCEQITNEMKNYYKEVSNG